MYKNRCLPHARHCYDHTRNYPIWKIRDPRILHIVYKFPPLTLLVLRSNFHKAFCFPSTFETYFIEASSMQCCYRLSTRSVLVGNEVCYKIVFGGWIVNAISFSSRIRALHYNALSFDAHWLPFPIYYVPYNILHFFFASSHSGFEIQPESYVCGVAYVLMNAFTTCSWGDSFRKTRGNSNKT